MTKCEFFKSEIESLGHLVSGKEIFYYETKVKSYYCTATNITEIRHILGLICYYRKFFPIFSAF